MRLGWSQILEGFLNLALESLFGKFSTSEDSREAFYLQVLRPLCVGHNV
jgi:hypothetical protein